MKIINVIITSTINQALNLAEQARQADIIELRIDALEKINLDELRIFKKQVTQEIIFTTRAQVDGGLYNGTAASRLNLLLKVAEVEPNYIDIEHYVDENFIHKLKTAHPAIKIIRSFHSTKNTPEKLNEIFTNMQHELCDIYKVVTYANSVIDVLKVLYFVQLYSTKYKLVAHAMGEVGNFSRIIGVILGNSFCYTQIANKQNDQSEVTEQNKTMQANLNFINNDFNHNAVPGIIFLEELINIYNIKKINSNTKIYALLGDPIKNSIGHIFHNNYFIQNNINAVYVKILLTKNQVEEFFSAIKNLPFYGFSITMPLKQVVLPLVQADKLVEKIGATNTIKISNDNILLATNTDAVGALDTIETQISVKDKHILVIGAGGAAKAICYAAYIRGANIIVINRTLQNARQLVEKYSGVAFNFANIVSNKQIFDVVINTVSYQAKLPVNCVNALAKLVTNQTTYIDINYSKPSIELQAMAKHQNLKIINGFQMFNAQAHLQQEYFAINGN